VQSHSIHRDILRARWLLPLPHRRPTTRSGAPAWPSSPASSSARRRRCRRPITEASGLHHTDAAALRALDAAAGAPITVSRLGADLNLSSGAVTALVDRLERHGMVQRTRDAGDRRRVHVSLTPKARALGADLLAPIADRIGHAIGDLDAADLRVVERYLASVVGARRGSA
jgi:DNA-binding MarR family transcriptional regulator